jgi:serine/threonine protein kinase/tetratricopeptide (TPR) repeat protein
MLWSQALGAEAPPGYQLLGEVGRGGMGVVWRAHDVRLDREVAIKFLRPELADEAAATERFLTEARITGRLQHPGIPAVHELGTLPDGRPFLAMKLVRGRTLQELLKTRHLSQHPGDVSSRDRQAAAQAADRGRFLAVFEQICHAVGYAHAHKVIHRDLKPSNVMVGEFGEVQVMDWGLAKVLTPNRASQEAADEPPIRDCVGEAESLDLASYGTDIQPTATDKVSSDTDATVPFVPAQKASGSADSVTRTGSILGTPAYMPPEQARGDIRQLDARSDVFGLGAILCQILTGRPPYQGRNPEAVRLQAMRGELDEAFAALDACGAEPELVALCRWCLAFRQEDRPADGRVVAAEVARIRQAAEERARQAELEHQRLLVREAEGRKRRRLALLAASSIVLVLLVGLAVSLSLMARAIRAEATARENEQRAELRRIEAETERQRAEKAAAAEKAARLDEERERRFAQAIADFVKEDFLALTSVEGQERFGGKGLDRNTTLLDLLNRAANKLQHRKDLDPRIEAELCWIVGINYRGLGEAAKALPFLERAWELRKQVLGVDHHDTLSAQNSLAVAYQAAGRIDLMVPLLEAALESSKTQLGPHHLLTLTNMTNLAGAYYVLGQLDKALPLFEEALSLQKTHLGLGHMLTLATMNSLALAYQTAGLYDQALLLHEETLKLRKMNLGADHPATITSMNNLAAAYQEAGRWDKALPLFEDALALRQTKLGHDHPETLAIMHNLACAYQSASRLEKALPLYEETLQRKRAKLGAKHPAVLPTLIGLGLAYKARGEFERALPLLREAVQSSQALLGAEHPETLTAVYHLASAYHAAGRLGEALPLYEQAAVGVEKRQFQHELAQRIMVSAVESYEEARQFAQAEAWRWKWLAHVREKAGAESARYADELAGLGRNLLHQSKYGDAEAVLRDCLAIREKRQPESWTTFHTMSLLGGALLGQRKYAEAEGFLVNGYEGMKGCAETIPEEVRAKLLAEALDRLIELSTALDRPDDVQKWLAEKANLPRRAD